MNKRIWALSGLIGVIGAILPAVIAPTSANAAGYAETIFVDSRNPNPVQTVGTLQAGTPYTVTASGTYNLGFGNSVGDAECSTLPPDSTFQSQRYIALDPAGDVGDLYVAGANVAWTPSRPDAFGCNSANHVYTYTYVPTTTGKLSLRIHERDAGGYTDNTGALKVVVSEARTLVESLTVPADSRDGATSGVILNPAKSYQLEISGEYVWNDTVPPSKADAECVRIGTQGTPLDGSGAPVVTSPGIPDFFGAAQTPT